MNKDKIIASPALPPQEGAGETKATAQPLTIIQHEVGRSHPADRVVSDSDLQADQKRQSQLIFSQKMASVGYLATGIVHEINTPMQYIRDNMSFLQQAFADMTKLIQRYRTLHGNLDTPKNRQDLSTIAQLAAEIEVDYLMDEIPQAISQSQEGLDKVARILRAMKTFSHPGNGSRTEIDIHQVLENALTISTNEWKHIANIERTFEPNLPRLLCYVDELSQVFLNLFINAAHAIAAQRQKEKGFIRVLTRKSGPFLEIRISDSGRGIPEEVRAHVFDPFFTTKAVGKGTGQGLAIAHAIVVQKHHGDISFESEIGQGTTFTVRLPFAGSAA